MKRRRRRRSHMNRRGGAGEEESLRRRRQVEVGWHPAGIDDEYDDDNNPVIPYV